MLHLSDQTNLNQQSIVETSICNIVIKIMNDFKSAGSPYNKTRTQDNSINYKYSLKICLYQAIGSIHWMQPTPLSTGSCIFILLITNQLTENLKMSTLIIKLLTFQLHSIHAGCVSFVLSRWLPVHPFFFLKKSNVCTNTCILYIFYIVSNF